MKQTAAFHSAFSRQLLAPGAREQLRTILGSGRLKDWTQQMTAIAVSASRDCGWLAAARGHTADFLPVARSEYLALDVVAFAEAGSRWRYPAAAIELENSPSEDKVAYAFWKTLCVHAGLRVTFCYRKDRDAANRTIRHLRDDVIGSMGVDQRCAMDGDTCVVVGHHDEGGTFPHGFFSWWQLDTNTGAFLPI